MLQRVESSAVAASGAIPVFNVDTGNKEWVTSEKRQKRAHLLVNKINTDRNTAIGLTNVLMQHYEAAGQTPGTPDMTISLHHMWSFSQDTTAEIGTNSHEQSHDNDGSDGD